jgi:exosortase
MAEALEASVNGAEAVAEKLPPFEWQSVLRSPAFVPGVALALGMVLAYLPLMQNLWTLWTSGDGYYSHGFLVPPFIAYIVARRWDNIKATPVRPSLLAALPIIGFTWIAFRAGEAGISMIMAACLVGTLIFGTAFVAGWKWMAALLPASLYSIFALPFWSAAIDAYTNPLQLLSTKVAAEILKLFKYQMFMTPQDPTTIVLNNFTLNVAIPCSGLKLLLALTAFVVFFVLIARLPMWANALLLACVLPMALFFNGLRIALIGMVGNAWGLEAGLKFHDYSGFITLLICFVAFFKFARALGWKD